MRWAAPVLILSFMASTASAGDTGVVCHVVGLEDSGQKQCVRLKLVTMEGATLTLTADQNLVEAVRLRFAGAAPVVFDAIVSGLGRALLRKRTSGAAATALARIEAAGEARYFDLLDGVYLTDDIAARMARIAKDYFYRAGRRLTVTSGVRDPERQAKAMYTKMQYGSDLTRLYRNGRAVRAIQRAFKAGRKAKRQRSEIVAEMSGLIDKQVQKGVYISKHLVAGAVDVRSRDMSAQEKRWFRAAVRSEERVRVIHERRPPHFHLSFR